MGWRFRLFPQIRVDVDHAVVTDLHVGYGVSGDSDGELGGHTITLLQSASEDWHVKSAHWYGALAEQRMNCEHSASVCTHSGSW